MNNSILKCNLVKVKHCLIVFTLFFLVACTQVSKPYQFYSGTKRSNDKVANLNNFHSGLLGGDIRLMAINGIFGPEGGRGYGYTSVVDGKFNVELLPGKYDISIMLMSTSEKTNQITLELEAEAGHVYHIKNTINRDDFGPDTAKFYIKDVTGKE